MFIDLEKAYDRLSKKAFYFAKREVEDMGDKREIKTVEKFEYLGLEMENSANTDKDIMSRICTTWLMWKKSSGVSYDKYTHDRGKRKFYNPRIHGVSEKG